MVLELQRHGVSGACGRIAVAQEMGVCDWTGFNGVVRIHYRMAIYIINISSTQSKQGRDQTQSATENQAVNRKRSNPHQSA
jgi:hypothetical protein